MATLQEDIKDIFMETTGADPKNPGKIPRMAEQLSQAIIDWLKKQTFRIKRMEATVELENFQLLQPLQSNPFNTIVSTDVIGSTSSGGGPLLPGAKGTGKGFGTAFTPVNVSKGVGGLVASGHAYIGAPAEGKPNADTTEEDNDYAVVQIVDGEEVA